MANKIHGTRGDDDLDGTPGNDVFLLGRGGNDTAHGGDGDDVFRMGGALNAGDHLDGGTGFDEIRLDGDYAQGLVLGADTITGIERIRLAAGHDYSLTTNDGNVAAGETLIVNAGPLHAGDAFTFDGSAESDGAFTIYGGAGDDAITGGAQADIIDIGRGGHDTVHGGGGNDHFYIDGAFDAADQVDGGSGNDTAVLLGSYAGLDVTGSMLQNVETLLLRDGHYALTLEDGVVASGKTLTVDGHHVHSGDLTVDASAESDGHYAFIDGTGNDTLSGGAQSDTFDLTHGGSDTVHGGGGDDTVDIGAAFGGGDHIDGGTGFDTVTLDGTYFLTLSADSFAGIERLVLTGPNNYFLTGNDGIVAAGQTMEVDGSALKLDFGFDGSSETDGSYSLIGGAGQDQLKGGAGDDTLQGGLDVDFLTGNGGADTFVYTQVADSTGTGYDRIADIDFSLDKIRVDIAPTAIDAAVDGQFDSGINESLEAQLGAAQLGAGHAVLFTDASNDELAGATFLVIDHNGIAGYQANEDYVIRVTGYSGVLTTESFLGG